MIATPYDPPALFAKKGDATMRAEEADEPSECEAYDGETGEVREPTRRRRRRVLTPEEHAVLDQRREDRAWMRRALEARSPALVVESDPPLRELGKPLTDVSRAREVRVLLRAPRLSGQGGPGTSLVISVRDYDGANGGEPGRYLVLFIEFHDGAGHKCRTRGVRVTLDDLRPVARALMAYADELNAEGARRESAALSLRGSRGEQLPWLDVEGRSDLCDPIERWACGRLEHCEDLRARHTRKVSEGGQSDPFALRRQANVSRDERSQLARLHDPDGRDTPASRNPVSWTLRAST
jgi:hypothetical protein